MQPRLYLDTSVFGGHFDEEFAAFTQPLFERISRGEFTVLFSTVTQDELQFAPKNVKGLADQVLMDDVEFLIENEEALNLATSYIEEKVVGPSSLADCLHIALATINHADYLVSWNFKHIVNIQRIRSYNSVNLKLGYRTLEIRSPRDLMSYENED